MAMMQRTSLILLAVLVMTPAVWCQSNNQPIQPGTYYLDSNADCNGPVREIYGQTVRVIGHGAIQEQQPPQSCTLQIRSASPLEQTLLRIQVVAATIRNCNVRLTIYDGDPGQSTLRGYDCNTPNKPNERDFITTGDLASFTLTRKDLINTQFDIEIYISPLVSGNNEGYENEYGDAWGFFEEKLENDAAIGIVGAVFAITIILVLIGILVCYNKHRGKNKPWEQHQLSTFRPETSIYEEKSKMSDTSSGVWASNVSRSQAHSAPHHRVEPNRHMARPSEDEDSVFDDATDVPPKKQLMERERRLQREREREHERRRGHPRDYASHNNSYVQADDDHPQDTFVERVITPRVRPSRMKPPSYEEAVESDTEKSELEDDEEDSDDVDHKETSEEESENPSSEEEEDEEEEEGAAAPKPVSRPKPQQGYPPHAVPLQPGMPPPGAYPPMYPMGAYPVPAGQFVPVMAHPPPQPYPPMMGPGPGHPPPGYPGQRPPQSSIRPTDPPVYSYLVQRGFKPLDPNSDGPGSLANTSQSQASADTSDENILHSGVEYMRR